MPTVLVVIGALAVAAVLAVVALRGGGEGDAGDGGQTGHDQAGHDQAGHEGAVEVLPGCDADEYHHAMKMFDPTVADALLDSGCPWPYDSSIALEGGQEDPSIAAPFEARRYAEVFEVVTSERFGMCAVSALSDERVDGFVFGFGLALRPGGCAEGTATVQVDLREYATRGWRDAAARAAAGEHVLVLGRWVVTVDGPDTAGAERFAALLEPLGAVRV